MVLFSIVAGGTLWLENFLSSNCLFKQLTLFLLFTAATWCESPDSKLVNTRLQSMDHGKELAYVSDYLAMMLFGTGTALLVMLPYGITIRQLAAIAAYVFCCAAFTRLIALITVSEARIDALAPFLALILCLAGGCFTDISHLAGMPAKISMLIPPGALIRAAAGNKGAFLLLLIEGCMAITAHSIVSRQ